MQLNFQLKQKCLESNEYCFKVFYSELQNLCFKRNVRKRGPIQFQWLKGTRCQSECTEAPKHVHLPVRSSSGAQEHLLRDLHSATDDSVRQVH